MNRKKTILNKTSPINQKQTNVVKSEFVELQGHSTHNPIFSTNTAHTQQVQLILKTTNFFEIFLTVDGFCFGFFTSFIYF